MKSIYLTIAALLIFSSCKKDELNCSILSIESAISSIQIDPCNGGTSIQYEISIVYTGDVDCFNYVRNRADFERSDNSTIKNVLITGDVTEQNSSFTTSGDTIKYSFNGEFPNQFAADDFDHGELEIEIYNKDYEASNTYILPLLASCTE